MTTFVLYCSMDMSNVDVVVHAAAAAAAAAAATAAAAAAAAVQSNAVAVVVAAAAAAIDGHKSFDIDLNVPFDQHFKCGMVFDYVDKFSHR